MHISLPAEISIDVLSDDLFQQKEVQVSMLRLDKIDKNISGNKLFKLFYFLQKAIDEQKSIVTFGGAWSNHLAATATACKNGGIKCTGIVRGERSSLLSDTLKFCLENGMELKFIRRTEYAANVYQPYGEQIIIPEGGFSAEGARGAALINNYFSENNYTHICCAIGSVTTFAGILSQLHTAQLLGFPALKGMNDLEERLNELLPQRNKNYQIINEYHFGGFAKKNDALLNFMNWFYAKHSIPTDFVYTAKMMFGIYNLTEKEYFKKGSKILCVHTGGLQGNASIKQGKLFF